MSRNPVRNLKASELVARHILDEILENDWPDGTSLPSEKALIERYEVARGSVREALRLLETRGLIKIRTGPGGGPTVRRPRSVDLVEPLSVLLNSTNTSVLTVMEARLHLEPQISGLTAMNVSTEGTRGLDETIDVMRGKGCDDETFLLANLDFHAIIAAESGNTVLRSFSDALNNLGQRARTELRYGRPRMLEIAQAHQDIADAIRVGDRSGAEAAMHTHLEEVVGFWTRRHSELSVPLRWIR